MVGSLDECDLSEGSSELARWQYPASEQVTETKGINPSREGHASSSGEELLNDTNQPTVFSQVCKASLCGFAGHRSIHLRHSAFAQRPKTLFFWREHIRFTVIAFPKLNYLPVGVAHGSSSTMRTIPARCTTLEVD